MQGFQSWPKTSIQYEEAYSPSWNPSEQGQPRATTLFLYGSTMKECFPGGDLLKESLDSPFLFLQYVAPGSQLTSRVNNRLSRLVEISFSHRLLFDQLYRRFPQNYTNMQFIALALRGFQVVTAQEVRPIATSATIDFLIASFRHCCARAICRYSHGAYTLQR